MAIVILQALEIAIEKVLEVLVEKHSGTFSPSFDEVERGAIEDAKQAFSSGLSEDQRAVATKRFAAVEDVFSGLPEQDAAVAIINDFNQSLGDRSKGKKMIHWKPVGEYVEPNWVKLGTEIPPTLFWRPKRGATLGYIRDGELFDAKWLYVCDAKTVSSFSFVNEPGDNVVVLDAHRLET